MIEESYKLSEKVLDIMESDFSNGKIDCNHVELYEMVMESTVLPNVSNGKIIAKDSNEAKLFKEMYTNIFLNSYIVSLISDSMKFMAFDDKTLSTMASRIKKVRCEKTRIVKEFINSEANHLNTDEIFEKFREIIC